MLFFKTLLKIVFVFIFISCSSDSVSTSENPEPNPILQRIEISSSNGDRLDIGESTTLTVSGFDQSDIPIGIEDPIEWSVNNVNVSVDENGVVTGLLVGDSEITAAVSGVDSVFEIKVWDSSAPRTEIYVSDAGNFDSGPWQILKFDENGKNAEVFIDDNLAWPQDILFFEEQEVVLISNLNSGRINRHDANTGEFIDTFASGISGPTRMKIGPDNLLYVLQWSGDGLVQRYELDGTFVDNFTSTGIAQSIGIDWDAEGNLYVSSFNGKTVRKFDQEGNNVSVFRGLEGPTNVFVRGNGEIMVNDWRGGVIKRYNSEGQFIDDFITGLSQPEGIALLNGNFLIGNGGTGAVKMYNSSGGFIEDFIPSGTADLMTPNAVTVRLVN